MPEESASPRVPGHYNGRNAFLRAFSKHEKLARVVVAACEWRFCRRKYIPGDF
jgi:hypothetical protein